MLNNADGETPKGPSSILYVTNGLEVGALAQALNLARASQGKVKALVFCPGLPEAMRDYQSVYQEGLRRNVLDGVDSYQEKHGLDSSTLSLPIELEIGTAPGPHIVRRTLDDGHDLVIKEALVSSEGKGFKNGDMVLVRKCECPVWLHRASTIDHPRVAVAIDPESVDQAGHDLSLKLLRFARVLADANGSRLGILSCWDYPFEDYLRQNPWFQVAGAELSSVVQGVQRKHRMALEALVTKSGISGPHWISHTRGTPDQGIPREVERHGIELLVVGTMARTGIAGLITGNTSEDIIGELRCSVVALKPPGFVSPANL